MIEDNATSFSGKLANILDSLGYILPETVLVSGFLILLIFGLIFKKHQSITSIIASMIFIVSLLVDFQQWSLLVGKSGFSIFLGTFRVDSFAIYFKCLFDISGLLVIGLTYLYKGKIKESFIMEYYTIIVALVLGAHFMVMSVNLLSVYISLELVSLSSYILTGFLFNKNGSESGIKYLLFGALSSGLMLYGMSLLYGFSGTLNFTSQEFFENLQLIPLPGLIVALTLCISGFLFKASIVPFHLWTPDIYEASPTPVAALFSVVPKAASFVILARFVNSELLAGSEIMFNLLAILAIASMFVGNLSAIWQKNFKRMLAYSTIAQAGYILLGILAQSSWGIATMTFYITVYMVMNFAAFLLVQVLDNLAGSEIMQEFKGLGLRLPFVGVCMLLVMISLAGLPPTAGFLAKLFIFSPLWDTYKTSSNPILLWVFLLGLLNLVISLFYYLKLPFIMFFKKFEGSAKLQLGWKEYISLTLLISPLIIWFFNSEGIVQIINSIALNFN